MSFYRDTARKSRKERKCDICHGIIKIGYEYHGWRYIQGYADEDPVKTLRAISSILNDVEAVVMKIIAVDHELSIATAIYN